ncbi:MAG: NHL repeat-containing protein [Thermodesulfobacteriota bacterium]
MRIDIGKLLFATSLIAAATGLHAAETVKFRQTAPIYVDGKGGAIRQPEGTACRGNSLVIADTGNGRLLRYTLAGETWTPGGVIAVPQLPSPIRVEMNSRGEILALDGSTRRIVRISPAGEFVGYVAPAGDVKGAVVPRSLRVDKDDNLYLLEVSSARVLVLDPVGKPIREIPFPRDHRFMSDLALDDAGNIYLADSVGKRVYRVAKGAAEATPLTESLHEEAYFPASIATDKGGRIYLVDQNGSGVVILGPDGSFRGRRLSMGWKEGFLRYPAQMCVTENGAAFIADRGNNRIDGFLITE